MTQTEAVKGTLKKSHLLIWIIILGTIWSLSFLTSIYLNIQKNKDIVLELALSKAKSAIDKDMTYRHLISSVGGVYIPVSKGITPNPFLSHVSNRDITTTNGQKLTLVNSSYFTRLIHDYEKDRFPNGIRGHVTSLKPLRPQNAPDEWEKKALQALKNGARQWSGVSLGNEGNEFRLMYPRKVKASCLGCHKEKGYKIGSVLGGISTSVPLKPLIINSKKQTTDLIIWHFIFWSGGVLGLFLGFYLLRRQNWLLYNSALHDSLTGLPNRNLFMDRLDQKLEIAKRHNQTGAVLFFDLDRFKNINDSLGHDVGDRLLCEVGHRLTELFRKEDTIARLGGDEFVVMLAELDHDAEIIVNKVQVVVDKSIKALSTPFIIDSRKLYTPPSIGIALFSHESISTNEILKQADVAMYRAKDSGGNCSHFFLPSMQYAAEKRLDAEHDLRRALENNEFVIFYQPIIDIRQSTRIIGAEALIRWQHPKRGVVAPGEFIDIAEETGLILDLGHWVLNEVCLQIKKWNSLEMDFGYISINISPFEFQQANFVTNLSDAITKNGVLPSSLYVEITESMLLSNINDIAEKMNELKKLGFRFSIDDFGTGYSSLAYLKQLPLDTLKIDRSFVCDITDDPNDAAIVESTLAMSSRMGFRVIAEGVETQEQLEFLKEHQCDFCQGYFYSPPISAKEFEIMLKHNKQVCNEYKTSLHTALRSECFENL